MTLDNKLQEYKFGSNTISKKYSKETLTSV